MGRRMLDCDHFFSDREGFRALRERGMLFYQALWGMATPYGVVEANPASLSAGSRELAFTEKEVSAWIEIQQRRKKILLFQDGGTGRVYLSILAWFKHQQLKTPPAPSTPLPPWISCTSTKGPNGRIIYHYDLEPARLPEDFRAAPEIKIPSGVVVVPAGTLPAAGSKTPHAPAKRPHADSKHPATGSKTSHAPAKRPHAPSVRAHAESTRPHASTSPSPSIPVTSHRQDTSLPPNPPRPGEGGTRGEKFSPKKTIPVDPTFAEIMKAYPHGTGGTAVQHSFDAYKMILGENGISDIGLLQAAKNYAAWTSKQKRVPMRLSRWLGARYFRWFLPDVFHEDLSEAEIDRPDRLAELAKRGTK